MPVQTKTLRLIAIILVSVVLLGAAAYFGLKAYLVNADERNLARIAKLQAMSQKAAQTYHGEVVGSVLDDVAGQAVYELMVRTEDGRHLRIKYDLKSGEQISVKELGR